MNENLASFSEEQGGMDIASFLNDALHRLRSFWWIILLLTALGGALSYYHTSIFEILVIYSQKKDNENKKTFTR